MATLSQTTDLTKKIVLFGGGGIIGIILLFFAIKGGATLFTMLFPKPGPPPETAFNKLPALLFPDNITSQKFSYEIDTVSGNLGNFPDRIKVYKTIFFEPTLLTLQTIQNLVLQTKFTFNQTRLNDTTYAWNDKVRTDKRLTMNIISKDFKIESNFFNYTDLAATSRIDDELTKKTVTNFLTLLDLYPSDFDETKTKVELLKIKDNALLPVESPSEGQVARLDLYQKDVNKTPIVYPLPPYSSMHFIVAGPRTTEIMEATFSHQTVSDESSTYPVISVQKAFDELKKENAYIGAYYGTDKRIVIKNIYLAYYLGEEKQQYVMPVYVFEGKDGFSGYVSAVDQTWIQDVK